MKTKTKRGRCSVKPPITITISGAKASGKTTVASIIASALHRAGWNSIDGDEEDCWDLQDAPHRAPGWRPGAQAIEIRSHGR